MNPSDNTERWTFLSNHGHILIALSQDPEIKIRDLAAKVGITERAVMNILRDLQKTGFIQVAKVGRRNRYYLQAHLPLRHPLESHRIVGDLIHMIMGRSV